MRGKRGHDWTYARLEKWHEAEDEKLRKRFDVLCEARARELCRRLQPAVRITEIRVYPDLSPCGEDVLVRDENGDIVPWEIWYLDVMRDKIHELDFVDLSKETIDLLQEFFSLLELWSEHGWGYDQNLILEPKN